MGPGAIAHSDLPIMGEYNYSGIACVSRVHYKRANSFAIILYAKQCRLDKSRRFECAVYLGQEREPNVYYDELVG